MATSPQLLSGLPTTVSPAIPTKHKKSKDMDEKEHQPLPLSPIQKDFFAPLAGSPERQKRFVVIGDAGTGKKEQAAVARQMERHYDERPFGTVLALGDNVYKHGEPKDFQSRIAEPYNYLFRENVRFRPILGNHDVKYGHAEEQLKYWGDVPHYYTFTLGSGSSKAQFWAIDTTIMTPGRNGCFKTSKTTEIVRDTARRQALQQMAWLRKSLAESTAPIKVVFGHYPMFSDGPKATSPSGDLIDEDRLKGQQELENLLAPILTENGVNLYMAGHEHHFEKPKNVKGVYYMVSGAAGGLEKDEEAPKETQDLIRKCHFVSFDITPEGLRYQAISDTGETIGEGLIPKREQASVPTRQASLGIHPERQRLQSGFDTRVAIDTMPLVRRDQPGRVRANRSNPCVDVCNTFKSCLRGIGSLFARCLQTCSRREPQYKDPTFMV